MERGFILIDWGEDMAKKFKVQEEKDDNLKKLLIVMIIVLIIYIGYLAYIFLNNDKDRYGDKNIIIDMNEFYSYENGKIVDREAIKFLEYKEKYVLYLDNSKKGEYFLGGKESGDINFYDNNGILKIDPTLPILAITPNIKFIDYDIEDLVSIPEELNEILAAQGIYVNDNFMINEKIKIDLDNDKVDEEIYSVSGTNYSVIYILDDGKVEVIKGNYETDNDYVQNTIAYILDFNNDKKLELVVMSCDEDMNNYLFYGLDKDKYTEILED